MGVTKWVKEQWFDVSRGVWFGQSLNALRSMFSDSFWGQRQPAMWGTSVNYELARSLYRNDNVNYNLGAGFVRPIIDLSVEYIGMPHVTSDNGDQDAWLNECITDHWAPQLLQAYRDSMRDSKCYVRFRQPRLSNPLFTEEDRMHGKVDVLPPEVCHLQFDPSDPDFVIAATITHFIEVDERTDQEIVEGRMPRMKTHEILETITPTLYSFYDKSAGAVLQSWAVQNVWGFVPIWPVYNEYAADIGGGQSDIESVLPFIQAFHEVLQQALTAHKYHSTPKATFNVKNIQTFLKNNYPEVIDPQTGAIKSGAKIQWSGREVFFMEVDEKVGFVEARSVLGDSKTLLEFLIDCISVASETPKWAMLKDESVLDKSASVQPFEKKISRKRTSFSEMFVMLSKMALSASGKVPMTVRVVWPAIHVTDLAAKAQAAQQIILGFDVASQHEWIADETVIAILGTLFPEVNAPSIEKKNAVDNVQPAIPAPAPASDTQASNGNGSKKDAKKALATAVGSQS